MAKLPYFPFYPDDYLSSPGIITCDLVDEAIYFRLLLHSWKHDGCQLPDNIVYLRKLCKGVRIKRLQSVLDRHFERIELEKGKFYWRNARLFSEFSRSLDKHDKAKLSANSRWNKEKQYANAMRTQCDGNANQNQNQNQNQNHIKEESKYPVTLKKRVTKTTDPRVNEVFKYFKDQCKAVLNFEPVIAWGQDGKKIKDALKVMSLDEVKECIDFFLPSKKAAEMGATISIALTAHSINIYRQGGKSNGKTRYDELRELFGLPKRNGADGVCGGGDSASGSYHGTQAGLDGSAVLAGEIEEISEVENN